MYFAKQAKTFLLLLYGSPEHRLNTNTQIFEEVHTYIAAWFKHCLVCNFDNISAPVHVPRYIIPIFFLFFSL